jgi:hypothetical protein
MKRWLMFALTLFPAGAAFASCGSAFCMVDTTWSAQGAWTEPGVRFDLRYEYIDQDQPRAGRRKVGVGEIRQHHDEVRTVSRNWLATVDYAVSEKWGVSATLPILDRHHEHIHNHRGAQLPETWNFTEVGDLRVLARGLLRSEDAAAQRLDFYGPTLGLKLPTGKHDVRNAQGALAERTLQPGTGTTDVLFGGYFRRLLGTGASWFVDASLQKALEEREHFRPGAQVSANAGYGRQLSENFAWMVQLNLLHKYRDRGSEAEPGSSGGNFVFVSPGASWALTRNLQVYGFVQLPLYQSVNGVQLTADWAAVGGISTRF